MTKKWVYSFSGDGSDGNRDLKDLLGGKGANLAEMANLGLRVPPGFTITTEACLDFQENERAIRDEIKNQSILAIEEIEKKTNKKFGSTENPLLFSVRSGARVSMPGMMDTVLNLGLNESATIGLAKQTGNERFAWDSYRRFIQMYANVVMGFNVSLLESTLEDLKEDRGVVEDTELAAQDWKELTEVYKDIIVQNSGFAFPTDPKEQLWKAVAAVFDSWNNERAIKYRKLNSIDGKWGTAVNVQSMVYGNMGDDCGTGVCFTRDPGTGQKRFFGEYLINAQGEDVVAGIRTPKPLNEESKSTGQEEVKTLVEEMPEVYSELCEVYQKLEAHYKDMQDIEFTIEKGQLYLLQTRNGKRTPGAAVKIAVDLVEEGVLTKEEGLLKVDPNSLNHLLHPRLDPDAKKQILATGLPASPGAASGKICFTSERATERVEAGEKVLLVRQETSPEDIAGMAVSEGILTCRGGMTSHAAVVARGMGKPCVAGCQSLYINSSTGTVSLGGKEFKEGDFLTIDGGTGEVIAGEVPTKPAELSGHFDIFMGWADEVKKLKVRANADNPEDAEVALRFGANGIGLCRTEHMFFDSERILAVREMIFSEDRASRKKTLEKIKPFQKNDFLGLFKAMDGRPVNIRLLDPPLHEFLPHKTEEKEELAEALQISIEEVCRRQSELEEFNPMLGHRGCRLGITYPEIYEMQVSAIVEAACSAQKEGHRVKPEIMIPLISSEGELRVLKERLVPLIEKIMKDESQTFEYKFGTMIEIPRAAITADQVAKHADFFSFGTNDLTQTCFGLSRDDAGKFLPHYVHFGLYKDDPFVSIDESGVGALVEMAATKGKAANKNIHLGICGEHGGDPKSIEFCHRLGLDYVSCSPFRIPIARLAAAHASITIKE